MFRYLRRERTKSVVSNQEAVDSRDASTDDQLPPPKLSERTAAQERSLSRSKDVYDTVGYVYKIPQRLFAEFGNARAIKVDHHWGYEVIRRPMPVQNILPCSTKPASRFWAYFLPAYRRFFEFDARRNGLDIYINRKSEAIHLDNVPAPGAKVTNEIRKDIATWLRTGVQQMWVHQENV